MIAPEWFTQAVIDEKILIDRSLVDGHMHIYGCTINTKGGRMHAKIGDYIIREKTGTCTHVGRMPLRKLMRKQVVQHDTYSNWRGFL